MMKQLLLTLSLTMTLVANAAAQGDSIIALSRQGASKVKDAITKETKSKGLIGRRGEQVGTMFTIFTSAKEMYDGLQALKKG